VPESERWVATALDYLETRPEVRSDQAGVLSGRWAATTRRERPRSSPAVVVRRLGVSYDWGGL